MSNKITPEALIEMGFNRSETSFCLLNGRAVIIVDTNVNVVYFGAIATNATTIEDIKDLIRLFK